MKKFGKRGNVSIIYEFCISQSINILQGDCYVFDMKARVMDDKTVYDVLLSQGDEGT